MAGASGDATGMGGLGGWVVVFSKPEEQPRPTKLTEGDAAGTLELVGYGEDCVVVTAVGPSNTGLINEVGGEGGRGPGACSRRVTSQYSESSAPP